MTLKRRIVSCTFTLGQGAFGESGTDTVTVKGLRTLLTVDKVFGPGMGTLNMRIHGMTPDQMNQISALNQAAETIKRNIITVLAGNEGETLSTVFQGQITVAQQNLNSQPDTSMLVVAMAGGLEAVAIAKPNSYTGGVDAASVMQDLARQANLQFENGGVNVQLSKPYYPGSPRDQMRACAEEGNFNWTIDDGGNTSNGQNTLAIWPRNGARLGQIPLISKETGMIGYPDYSTSLTGLSISTVFNPFIRIGGQVKIESDLQVANGIWTTYEISHHLESETPNGQWMTRFGASANNG